MQKSIFFCKMRIRIKINMNIYQMINYYLTAGINTGENLLLKCNIINTRMRAAKLRFHLSYLHQVLKLPYTIRRRACLNTGISNCLSSSIKLSPQKTYLLYKTTKNVHHMRGFGNAINTDS